MRRAEWNVGSPGVTPPAFATPPTKTSRSGVSHTRSGGSPPTCSCSRFMPPQFSHHPATDTRSRLTVNKTGLLGAPRRKPDESAVHRAVEKRRGFALLITVTLLAFLVLLLVSLASLTRVETQVAGNNQRLAQARQNALMALTIALGQLQRHSGPDQRVTAAADVVIPAAVTINTTATGADARTSLDIYWAGSRNRHWTGVWRNRNTDPFTATSPSAANPVPNLEGWLVSGNETTATFTPTDTISGLTAASTPLDEIKDAAGRPYRLLVKSSADVISATTLDRAVAAPQVVIESSSVPGISGSVPVGHYAWWVGDEGVKARANLVDPYAAIPSGETAVDKLKRETTRRQSAQRLAIEAMTTNGTDGLAALDPARQATENDLAQFNVNLLKTVTPSQLAYVTSAATLPAELKTRFHDLSLSSRGVLSDTRHGGLKRDLSNILGQPNLPDFRTALNAVYDGGTAAPLSTYNPALTPLASPYATVPPEPGSGGADVAYNSTPGIMSYGATWEQLWSFYNMGNATSATPAGVFNGSGAAVPRRQTADQQGLYPLLIQAKLFYRLRIDPRSPEVTLDADGANRTGKVWIDTIPVVVLANPYNVALGAADYNIRFGTNNFSLRFGTPSDDPPKPTDFPTASLNSSNGYTGNIRLVLRSTGFAPGEAQIYTIDPDPAANPTIDSDDRVEITHITSDTKPVVMKNEYDPSPALTYNTTRSIPATATPPATSPPTHAALYSTTSTVFAKVYFDYDAASGDQRVIQSIHGQNLADSTNTVVSDFFLVDPLQDGTQQGGGVLLVRNEAPTTSTILLPIDRRPQQAPFYQVNYRGLTNYVSGNSSGAHLGLSARTYVKQGSTGSAGTAVNQFLEANLLRPAGNTRNARWGLVNIGTGFYQNETPTHVDGAAGFFNLLYDLPRPGQPLSSLGQLQHFNTTGHIPIADLSASNETRYAAVVHQWQVNCPIANSYPHPRVPREQVFNSTKGMGYHYDGSYLWNDVLWDRFFFSAYPQSGTFDFNTDKLANTRLRPFRDRNEVPWNNPALFRGDGNPATVANSRLAAQNLLVDGAFNVNSTSREAWKAVFSSLRNVPTGSETVPPNPNSNLTAPFARTLYQTGGAADSKAANTANAWNGIRNLTTAEIETLADEMVLQVLRRGPFLSVGEFVNRRLIASAADSFGLGLAGALQAALDKVLNKASDIAAPLAVKSMENNTSAKNLLADAAYLMPTAVSGFPGYLLQGDVLSVLGASLAARSDTFVIRTYGDATNPVTSAVEGRAWCEAVVQRLPDYVVAKNGASGNAPHETASDPQNITFGRRYKVVSFRWLSPHDI